MRLGPFELRRSVQAQEAPARQRVRSEQGASGTINLSGFLQPHEYNAALRGRQGLDVFDRMRRSDAAVREALAHIRAPLLNATWQVEPATDDPKDLEIAAFVEHAYFEWLRQPFGEYLSQALLYLAWGHNVFETPLQVIDADFQVENPDGEARTVTMQALTWKRFAQRLPHTITRWNMADGELRSVTQQAMKDGDYGEWDIPADQLVVYVNEKEGDDWTGLGLLRTAYKAWFLKEVVEKIMGVAAERHGVGVWVAYPPQSRADDSATIDRLEDILQNLRAGEFSYIVAPGPKAQIGGQQTDGYTFEILSPGGQPIDFVPMLEYLRGEIKGNVLARFAELGHGQTGARATSDTQAEVWYDALQGVANYISDVNHEAIRRLVLLNYPQAKRFPRLVAQDIESRNLTEFADTHFKLVGAGAIVVDDSYRAFVRREVGAPDEDEETAERIRQDQDVQRQQLEQERQPEDTNPREE